MMRGVILCFDTVSRGDIDLSRLKAELTGLDVFGVTAADAVAARLAGAAVAIVNKVRFDAALLRQLDDLQLICLTATGHDKVDLAAARANGIAVANVQDYCTASVVQHVFALILELTTHLEEYRRLVADGAWQQSGQFNLLNFPARELAGKTFGVIGYGALGRGVAEVARAFGMRVLVAERRGATPRGGRTAFETVLAEADILTLHCPLTDATRGLIGAEELAHMKPDALLINTARGAIVDAEALGEALGSGRLGGAGLDVLPQEPPPADDPLLARQLPNLIVTPHIAWAAREARQRVMDEIAANIRAFRAGVERNRLV
ncbi:MAG TPA: D-2-hydroxyacid dehydrogenase [Gammaproteobacteria bacterium]|nr:D-2-hydroxyacid dehydrogenase [Gammaproteobacteria bacterium]